MLGTYLFLFFWGAFVALPAYSPVFGVCAWAFLRRYRDRAGCVALLARLRNTALANLVAAVLAYAVVQMVTLMAGGGYHPALVVFSQVSELAFAGATCALLAVMVERARLEDDTLPAETGEDALATATSVFTAAVWLTPLAALPLWTLARVVLR